MQTSLSYSTHGKRRSCCSSSSSFIRSYTNPTTTYINSKSLHFSSSPISLSPLQIRVTTPPPPQSQSQIPRSRDCKFKSLTPLLCTNSSNPNNVEEDESSRSEFLGLGWIGTVSEGLSTAFPLWVALGCLLGLLKPSSFDWIQPRWTILGITVTMLGMGMTLTLDDLRGALAMPKELIAGFVLQYSVMPLSGYFVSKLLRLPSYYAAGLILVGCCPGGTASNIVTYIARGNVALSVLMTAASTLSAVVMTPFLTAKLAGQYVAVDAMGLLMSTLQNSVLGVVLATQHFGNPLTAVPCAVSSVCHSIFGSALAGIWRRSVPDKMQETTGNTQKLA